LELLKKDFVSFTKVINQQIPPPHIIVSKKPLNWENPYIHEAPSLNDVINTVERICINECSLFGAEINYLRHTQKHIYDLDRIVAESPQMKRVIALIRKISPFDTTVLITGETGTGKEVIASAIHFNSPRKKRAFVKVNCASLPETLLESELFGHEKGAFTGAYKRRIGRFEQANGGSIFLDEIGDMSPALQAKILRVLQEKEFERLGGDQVIKVDVRVLVATNRDLKRLIEEGKFREDLYYRINVVHIHLPPLRERREDIIPLAQFFLKRFNSELNKQIKGFSEEAKKLILDYTWPGNVRELENVVERAVLMAEGNFIHPEDLSIESETFPHFTKRGIKLKEAEKELIIQALKKTNWIQKKAAELLGISRRAIHYKIHKYGITHPRWKKK
ncbi:MAG TPA: sigma-54-dependent Fis family transcriptional regulator, partial [Candidatus Desulfofervidus auxilii]|nr:sigma-54-dependent Fis family transcriptional regulator [Candidatus Desulfofervidus auxilii]